MVYTSTPGNYIICYSDECHIIIIIHILTVPAHVPSRHKLSNTIAIRRRCRAENYYAGRHHAKIRVLERHHTRLLPDLRHFFGLSSRVISRYHNDVRRNSVIDRH